MPAMTSRQRMLAALRNQQPDRVPVAPDMSNMIPCRLTGKPFWDIYLYQDPPRWRAYIEAANYFGTDGWLDGVDGFELPDPAVVPLSPDVQKESVIIEKTQDRIVTRSYTQRKGQGKSWSSLVVVYPRADPPTVLQAEKVGLARPPDTYWPIEGVKPQKQGFDLLREAMNLMGETGVVALGIVPPQLGNPDMGVGFSIYDYYDRYDEVKQWSQDTQKGAVAYLKRILAGPVRPDFFLTGGSGMLIFNTPDIIKDLSLPALKEITRVCKEAGIPSQIHCCGPERALIEMVARETDLSSINPLEIPPMGDCDLAEIKKSFGAKLGLMGNLHTTEVMLRGTVKDVRRESLKAIRAAGEHGGFILSTGDQCGRDTPEANIREMLNVAREFGNYPLDMSAIDREIKTLGG